jgi:hypothetical protein
MSRRFRSHQRSTDKVFQAIADGETEIRDVLAAVTPGGGKSLLPVVAAVRLMRRDIIDKVCWIVPRDTLRLQAEEAFADGFWRTELGHGFSVRAAENAPDPTRGLSGYVTTYQSVAAAPDLHLAEFRRHRYLLAIDEMHHLPALVDTDVHTLAADETSWSRAIMPLLEQAQVRLLMSGTLERADGRPILWLPYKDPVRTAAGKRVKRIDFDAPGWAIVGYSRRQALAERAVLPVTFGAVDGFAEWLEPGRETPTGPVQLSMPHLNARPALFTALRTEFADGLLEAAFDACRTLRAERRRRLDIGPWERVRGLGKLLVVATDQTTARRYLEILRRRFPRGEREEAVRLAVSDMRDAHENIAAFRLRPDPSVLVTVAMAYEGMDCPEISHVACLTHIRSRPWLEQMIARATRVDPHGGPYENQQAVVFHPDDPMFAGFRHRIETEQGTKAKITKSRQYQLDLFPRDPGGPADGINPLRSNATTIRYEVVAPGPDFGRGPDPGPVAVLRNVIEEREREAVDPPSVIERRLRQQVGQLVAAQVIEDEDAHLWVVGRTPGYHAYNAVLKRVMAKPRATMTLAELEAALEWLARNRLSDHLHLIEGDEKYLAVRNRRAESVGG